MNINRPTVALAWALGPTVLLSATLACAQPSSTTRVGELVVTAPLPGASIDPDKLPTVAQTVGAKDFEQSGSLAVADALEQQVAGLSLSDTQGNGFTKDVDFRGFKASPLEGTPEGLAVYMGGVRLNEAFGDTVNWDLIPQTAIAGAQVSTGSPAFGLNALGGAVSLTMKTGFDTQGGKASVEGGSFGRTYGSGEYAARSGAWGAYVAVEGGHETGWRQQSSSSLARLYADIGWKDAGAELHLVVSGGADDLGAVGPTPVDMLSVDRSAVYTYPQTTRDQSGLLELNGKLEASAGWELQGALYARRFEQRHLDGNNGDLQGCTGALSGTLCAQDDAFPAALRPPAAAFQVLGPSGAPIGCPAGQAASCDSVPYGTLDRTATNTSTWGLSLQADRKRPLFGHDNLFLAGASIDDSRIRFSADSTLGVILPDLQIGNAPSVPGSGLPIHTAGAVVYSPVSVGARTTYYGLYAADTLDVTPTLSLTVSGRFNSARLGMTDLAGTSPALTGDHRFDRLNPAAGLAWRLLPAVTLYGGYSESNRAPTPLELGCSDPLRPCLLESALVADPPLKQVVAHTWEAGARGRRRSGPNTLEWSASLFRTDSENDIVALASQLLGRGSYANVPGTRRQGLEANVRYEAARWSVHAGYSHIEATYQFTGALSSPNSPFADVGGNVAVRPGDRMGGVPADRFKAGADVSLTRAFSVGADMVAVGSQYLVGDESNQDRPLPGYWTMDLRASYRLGRMELFSRIDNLFDRDYATYGSYFDPTGVANLAPSPLPAQANPRTLTSAAPRSILAGVRVAW